MAYNINYTTLPTFTSNSIGNLVASQNYTTFSSTYSSPVFSVSVSPGIYLFTAAVDFSAPEQRASLLQFNLENSSIVYCAFSTYMYNDNASSETMGGSLSHVFSVSASETLYFYITEPGGVSGNISYALVRLA